MFENKNFTDKLNMRTEVSEELVNLKINSDGWKLSILKKTGSEEG
jgi:hypothetical protein